MADVRIKSKDITGNYGSLIDYNLWLNLGSSINISV